MYNMYIMYIMYIMYVMYSMCRSYGTVCTDRKVCTIRTVPTVCKYVRMYVRTYVRTSNVTNTFKYGTILSVCDQNDDFEKRRVYFP